MRIGVFDSGIGGKAIAQSIKHEFSDAEIEYVDDATHLPYGNREGDEIIFLTDAAIQPLLKCKCDVIVLACNTATAAAIETLRKRYPDQYFIGLEPMVKTASSMSITKTIAICATPFTLASNRYQNLKNKYAVGVTVFEPDCSEWASMIEEDNINYNKIARIVESVCDDGADIIVLACTHYHWIKKEIQSLAKNEATVIDPSDAIIRRIRQITNRSRSY
jgi:glutamate racemase